MSAFAVIREAGPGWRDGGIHDQPAVDEHAAFMNALADSGFLLIAGPLAGTEHGRVRVLLIVNAEDEDQIHHQLADDPWVTTEQLVTISHTRFTASNERREDLRRVHARARLRALARAARLDYPDSGYLRP
jgi:uncharacterized protein YciI